MTKIIKPPLLKKGDTIGIVAPCYVINEEVVTKATKTLEELGFKVILGDYVFENPYGYGTTREHRAADFNKMINDENVRMVLFDGGEIGHEILPDIDYEAIKKDPKIFSSYSDATSILNAIFSKTGVITFYGQSQNAFYNLSDFNYATFKNTLLDEFDSKDKKFLTNSNWTILKQGKAEGTLIGGYILNFALMANGNYCNINKDEKYILFIEDHISFNGIDSISRYFAQLEQTGIFNNVTGLIFGHYDVNENPALNSFLKSLGDRFSICVAKCDDFGHGANFGLIPIGAKGILDTDNKTLTYTLA